MTADRVSRTARPGRMGGYSCSCARMFLCACLHRGDLSERRRKVVGGEGCLLPNECRGAHNSNHSE